MEQKTPPSTPKLVIQRQSVIGKVKNIRASSVKVYA